LEEILDLAGLHPSLVISPDVAPLGFNLIASSPDEVSISVLIEGLEHAIGKVLDLLIREESRVVRAETVLNHVAVMLAPWGDRSSSTVEVRSNTVRQVGFGALYPFAGVLRVSLRVVDAIEPEGASVSGKSPLTSPDGVLDGFKVSDFGCVEVDVPLDVVITFLPGHVRVSV